MYSVEPAYVDTLQAPEQDVHMEQYPPLEDAAVAPKKSKKLKKRKKKVRPHQNQDDIAPVLAPPGEHFNDYPAEVEPGRMQEQLYEEQQYPQMNDDQQRYDHQQFSQTKFDRQQYDRPEHAGQHGRPATPHRDKYADAGSPHPQLNEDLQAAAWVSNEMSAPTAVITPFDGRNGNGLPPSQTRTPTPSYRPREPTNPPMTGMTDRPRTAVQSGKSNYPQIPAFNIEDHSAFEPPSSDIEREFEHLRRKVSRISAQKSTQLTAEKQSLQNELQQAIGTKRALEDQVSTLQQDKESLMASVEEEKAKSTNLTIKIAKFKTFVGGIGNDMEHLKKEAESYHNQSKQLVTEAGEHLQQMANRAEESKRLNEEVVKQCQANKLELSTAATRAVHLEERLKERSDALAEEKELRLEFQSQLVSVEHANNAVLRQQKADNDAVLDKLYEIHAMLEESDNRGELTKMLEKTAATIQGLNSQQGATVDDIVLVKGMVESLTER